MSRLLVLAALIATAAPAAAGPAPAMAHLPDIQTAQLDNGLRIAFLRRMRQPK